MVKGCFTKPYRLDASTGRKVKILAFFIHRYRWGEQIRGDERRFLEVSKQFKNLGVTVYALELEPSLQDCLNESIYVSLKVNLSLKESKGLREQIATLFHLVLATLRLSLKVRYDLIYVHNQDIENMVPAYTLKLVFRKPLVLVFHGFSLREKLSIKDKLVIRLKKGFSPQAALVTSVLDLVKRFICQRADFYITITHAVQNDAVRYLKARRILVVGDGVDMDKFRPYDLEKSYDAAFLGRVHPQKGIETLLKAWKVVVAQKPSAKLVIIGGGKRAHVGHYRTLLDKLGLRENVEMRGFVSDEEVVRLLNLSKLFVFPSVYEGFAISVAEAMACGLPCVISDIPVLRENYGEVAILVKPNDVRGFAEVTMELLKDEKKRKELGERVREYVAKFSWGDVAKRELEVFNHLLRRTPAS